MIRRAHAGSAGKVSLALVAALVLVLAFAVAVSAKPAAPSGPPNLPHFFYGNVTTDLGTPLPGMLVTAQAVTGSWTGTSAKHHGLHEQVRLHAELLCSRVGP